MAFVCNVLKVVEVNYTGIITVKICIVLINYVNVQCWSDPDCLLCGPKVKCNYIVLRVYVRMSER